GVGVKINLAKCADETQAEALRKRFVLIHNGDEVYAVRRGTDVAEIACVNRAVARKARDVIGWDKDAKYLGPAYYKATMHVAPLVRCDGMHWNRLFNLLSAPDDQKNAAAIEEEAKAFEFDEHFESGKEPSPRVLGVPRVEVVRHVTVPVFRTGWTQDDAS